jgi:hypothetical protein
MDFNFLDSTIMHYAKTKRYSTRELAELYEVDPKTFRKWIKPLLCDLGERVGRYYNIYQVGIIFLALGKPYK